MKKLLLFLAAITTVVSCSKDVDTTPSTDGTDITLSVRVSTPLDTRVDIADNGEGGYAVSWLADDALACYGTASDAYYVNQFTIASDDDYDTESAIFTGRLPWSTTAIRFIHPYNSRFTQSNGVVSIDISAQSVGADLSHLSANTLMLSNAVEIESVSDTYVSESVDPLIMSHLGAAIELKIGADDFDVADYTLTEVVISELPTAIEVDMANDAAVTETATGAITLTADNITATGDAYYVVFNSLPFTVTAGETITVDVTLCDANEAYYSATATISGSEDVTFAKAQKHTIYAKLGEATSAVAPQEELSITSDTTGTTGEQEVDGVALYFNDAYVYTTSGVSYISMNTNGYIYNLAALEGLSKIVIDYKDGYRFVVYQGSASNPLTSVVTPTEDGNKCTYEITDDNTFFSIVKESSSYVNAYSITAYYDSIGDISALFTGVSTASIIFDGDVTDPESVTIEGNYLANATTVTAKLDDDTYFTVSAVSSEDYSFTVTPKGTNSTSDAYTATVTVTVDGKTMDVAVSQRGAAQAALVTTTITGSDFSSGSYSSNDGDKTIQYIDFFVTNCYLNSSAIQMAKSSQSGGVGSFYNTVALIGLNTITIDVKTNSVVVYTGTTANPTTVLTGVNDVYTVPAGDQYFRIEATSSYAVVNSVAITYESIEGAIPTIVSADPESVAFAVEGGSEDVALSMLNYSNETITAVSNNDQFTATVSGTTVTVSTIGANDGTSSISGVITISVDGGNSIELPVSQKSNVLEETLVASFTTNGVIGTSSYTATETELTQDGILFGYANCYKNSSYVMQMNNSDTRSCQFYNKDAIPGLSKIVITVTSTKYHIVNAGSTQIPDDAAVGYTVDGSVYTFTITDGSEYFMIEPQTTGALYTTSIEIYAIN